MILIYSSRYCPSRRSCSWRCCGTWRRATSRAPASLRARRRWWRGRGRSWRWPPYNNNNINSYNNNINNGNNNRWRPSRASSPSPATSPSATSLSGTTSPPTGWCTSSTSSCDTHLVWWKYLVLFIKLVKEKQQAKSYMKTTFTCIYINKHWTADRIKRRDILLFLISNPYSLFTHCQWIRCPLEWMRSME